MSSKDAVSCAHSRWMESDGPESDVVVSSRVRVARNLTGIPFPHMLGPEKTKEVVNAVRLALNNEQFKAVAGESGLIHLSELSPVDRQILVDKHLISPDMLNDFQNKAVVMSQDETIVIMINEEDHLRMQCLLSGLQLTKAWEIINQVDDGLEQTIDFAFSEKLGYLTSCPTNVGTGLRASVMLHLPGLKLTRQLGGVLGATGKLGLTIRGLYGEGTEAVGDLFQISNQITLGQSEEEIIDNLISVSKQIMSQEQAARQVLYNNRREVIEDRVFRAYGILKHARILSSEEAMRLFSDLRLGLGLKAVTGIPAKLLNELMVKIRPAFMVKIAGREMSAYERDSFRAGLIRKELEI